MKSVGPAEFTILLELKLVGSILLVLGRRIIPPLTFCTSQGDNVSHISLRRRFRPHIERHCRSGAELRVKLLDYFGNDASADSSSAFPYGKAEFLFHGNGGDKVTL